MQTFLKTAVTLFILIFATISGGCMKNPEMIQADKRERTKRLIQRELPAGTDRNKVEAFLTSQKIEHSAYDNKEHNILAIIRGTSAGPLVKSDIQIRFDFDDTGALKHFELRDVHTGP